MTNHDLISYSKTYTVDTFTANSSKRLGLLGLVGILQDISACHAQQMGLGLEDMLKMGVFWVITKKSIRIKKWPKMFDEIEVKTWPIAPEKSIATRDFMIFCNDELIGDSSCSYVTLDAHTRRPVRIDTSQLKFKLNQSGMLNYRPSKIFIDQKTSQLEHRKTFEVRNSDLDFNGHVNNTKFTQWILDSIDYQLHKTHQLSQYHINFLSEVKLGQSIDIYKDLTTSDLSGTHQFIGHIQHSHTPAFSVQIISDN